MLAVSTLRTRFPFSHPTAISAEEGCAAGLDCLELGHGDGLAAEASRKLVAVEVEALGGVNGAKLKAGETTDARLVISVADGLLEGTVLLGVLAVAGEASAATALGAAEILGELARGRLGVRLGGVVDGG